MRIGDWSSDVCSSDLLAANLLIACERPDDLAARGAMLLGAHLAGVAFAHAPVAGVHALAYPLGGHFHVPHGLPTALLLPRSEERRVGKEWASTCRTPLSPSHLKKTYHPRATTL